MLWGGFNVVMEGLYKIKEGCCIHFLYACTIGAKAKKRI